jgi:YidC/Oxa1 family membrane protein insertase
MMGVMLIWFQFFMPEPTPRPVEDPAAENQLSDSEPFDQTQRSEPGSAEPSATTVPEWPFLPPVAEQADPTADETTLLDDDLELVFTAVGARLKRAKILDTRGPAVQLVPEPETDGVTNSADHMYALGLHFTNDVIGDELDRRRWDLVYSNERSVKYQITLPEVAVITKTFQLDDISHIVDVSVEYENIESGARSLGKDHIPAFVVSWGPNVASDDLKKGVQQQFVWRINDENETLKTANLEINEDGSTFEQLIGNQNGYPEWIAVRSAYFLVGFRPEIESSQGWLWGSPEFFRFGMAVPSRRIPAGESLTADFQLYVGPSNQAALAAAWPTLDTSLKYFEWFGGMMNPFAKFLLSMLNWFYGLIPNYGIAIILLTVVVRLVMVPLTIKQMRSMKQMQALAPEVEALREKYKDDQQEQSKRMMEMYRERGVNPLGGCFPLLLQMPIFIALYRMLWSSYELRGAPFIFWIKDLSEPDRLVAIPGVSYIPIPFLAEFFSHLNILPILSAAAMIISTRLMPMTGASQNPQQKMIMNIMPVVFSVICYNFASGLNLYIFVSTTLGIVQNKLVNRGEVKMPEKKAPKKPRKNAYAAAQARKKRVAKEAKSAKKKSGQPHKGNRKPDNKGPKTP